MKKLIYLLEDDTDIREMIEYLLWKETHTVQSFGTVTAFRESLATATPNLFIMDIMLPDGNGIEMCQKMKSSDATRHIPILLMSANLNNRLKSLECEADDFISKPFDIDQFIGKVNFLTHAAES
jgi:two-component system, OmpR family, phosphate regulon response regulator PhoB